MNAVKQKDDNATHFNSRQDICVLMNFAYNIISSHMFLAMDHQIHGEIIAVVLL